MIRHRAVSVLAVSLVACSSGSATTTPMSSAPTTTEPSSAPAEATDATSSVPDATGALSADDVLAALAPSTALVETAWGTGNAIAVDDGYLLVDAHAVGLSGTVDVTPTEGARIEDVPVVGVDHESALALIGPLDPPLQPVSDAPSVSAQPGDPVHLVGYPNGGDGAPMPTISDGLVSELHDLTDWDQHYVQADAHMTGGRSSGVLVDAGGQVIGISSATATGAFSLALSLADALDRLPLLRSGGRDWHPLPPSGVNAADVTLQGPYSILSVVIEALESDTEVTLTLSGAGAADGVGLEVMADDGTAFASRNLLARAADQLGIAADELEGRLPPGTLLDPSTAGSYTFPLARGTRATLMLRQLVVADPLAVSLTSNVEFIVVPDLDDGVAINVGGTVTGTIEPTELQDRFELDLTAGQSIDIEADSSVGALNVLVVRDGDALGRDTFSIATPIGFGGRGAQGIFTATQDGRHHIIVLGALGQSAYRLRVSAA